MILRICFSGAVLLSILFLPFWVSIVLALLGIIFFSIFWEVVAIFFLSDLLYGIQEAKLFNIYFFSFTLSLVLLICIELLKKKLKFYKEN